MPDLKQMEELERRRWREKEEMHDRFEEICTVASLECGRNALGKSATAWQTAYLGYHEELRRHA